MSDTYFVSRGIGLIQEVTVNRKVEHSPHVERSYELTFEDRADYFYASVENNGEGREVTEDYIGEIADACIAGNCEKLLIEKMVPGSLWIWDSVSVIDQFPKAGLSDMSVVFVDRSVKHFGASGFSVLLGKRALIDVHVFSNLAAGEAWLREH